MDSIKQIDVHKVKEIEDNNSATIVDIRDPASYQAGHIPNAIHLSDNTVEKNMASEVETIDKNMNIFDAATKFISSKRRRFPIVENGKLIGQISQKDVLKAALKMKGNSWK